MLKQYLIVFLVIAVLLGIIIGYAGHLSIKSELLPIEIKEEAENKSLQSGAISESVKDVASDLLFFSLQEELVHLLESKDNSVTNIAEEYLKFARISGLYDQLRVIDGNGMEIIRINFNNGKPLIVPHGQLQNKKNRYYFSRTFELNRGEVYISPFDLNIEKGEIEKPIKPVIRFATPIFDSKGKKLGIVILNYFGSKMIKRLKDGATGTSTEISLVNSDGYWFFSPNPEDNWGFMYEEKKDKTFGNKYQKAWERISKEESGQFYTENGFFTFSTVYPLKEAEKLTARLVGLKRQTSGISKAGSYYWKTISHIPKKTVQQRRNTITKKFVIFYLEVLTLLSLVSWFLLR